VPGAEFEVHFRFSHRTNGQEKDGYQANDQSDFEHTRYHFHFTPPFNGLMSE
jgi:hypothetical protein